MKFSLVAIFVAFLCASAVTAAPSSPNFSFEEVALSNAIGFGDLLRDYWLNIKCVGEILKQESSAPVKALWAEYKIKFAHLFKVEWKSCEDISNIAEQEKCKAVVIEKGIAIYAEFFTKLAKVANWQKVREIRKKIVAKCVKHDVFDESDDFEEFTGASLPEQFQCLVDVLGDVSKKNDLEDLWSKSQPQLQLHLDNWKGCANTENKFAQLLCNIKEGVATYRLINDYLRLIAAQKPILVSQIVREVQQKCSAHQESAEDLLEIDDLDNLGQNVLDKIKCYTEAITDALKATDFAKPWDNLKKDLEKLAERVKACQKQSSFLDVAKCVAKETASSKAVISAFLKNMKIVNKGAYDLIMKNIKTRCQ